jgi:predicted type IV restriction endonuclease
MGQEKSQALSRVEQVRPALSARTGSFDFTLARTRDIVAFVLASEGAFFFFLWWWLKH